MSKRYQTDAVRLGDIEVIQRPGKPDLKIAKFLTLGATIRSMDEKVFGSANYGDEGYLEFEIEQRATGKYIEDKVIYKAFVVTKPANGKAKQAAAAGV